MTRYYKFLIVNVLVFFCVGTAALQSFLVSFKSTSGQQILQDVSDSFPTAGPFYVGWRKRLTLFPLLVLYLCPSDFYDGDAWRSRTSFV
jgi:hypothetical protein